jgi:hypothetical protein
MIINITSKYDDKNIYCLQHQLKNTRNEFSSSLVNEPKIKVIGVNTFNSNYLKDPEFLTIHYKNLQNDL